MQMNLSARQLRAFLALAESRSFTRAAAASFLSQPAFSALIQSLEAALQQRLFDRSTRHVDLTVEGRAFEVSARRILAEVDDALAGVVGHLVNLPLASRHFAVAAAGVATLAAAEAVAELDDEAAGHLTNLCVFGSLH